MIDMIRLILIITLIIAVTTCVGSYAYMKYSERRILMNGIESTSVITGYYLGHKKTTKNDKIIKPNEVLLDLSIKDTNEVIAVSTLCTRSAYKKYTKGRKLDVKYLVKETSDSVNNKKEYEVIVLSKEREWGRVNTMHLLLTISVIVICLGLPIKLISTMR